MQSDLLINELIEISENDLIQVQKFVELDIEALNAREAEGRWSVLECIEHLNLYCAFYVPAIEQSIAGSKVPSEAQFKPGLLGSFFADAMQPKPGQSKMKTFTSKNPIGSALDKSCIESYIAYHKRIIELLNDAKEVSLNKNKTPITLAKWIKLKLGDTFRVVVYHNQRHIIQAQNVLKHLASRA